MIEQSVKNRLHCEQFLVNNGIGNKEESRNSLFHVEGKSLLDAPGWVIDSFADAIRHSETVINNIVCEKAENKFKSFIYDLRDPLSEAQSKISILLDTMKTKE